MSSRSSLMFLSVNDMSQSSFKLLGQAVHKLVGRTASVRPMQATAEAARRFLVARHFLAPPRSVKGGKKGVLKVIAKLGSIQFDPLAIAGRNHDLVLHARVADYKPELTDR